jgi:hypothetical protein
MNTLKFDGATFARNASLSCEHPATLNVSIGKQQNWSWLTMVTTKIIQVENFVRVILRWRRTGRFRRENSRNQCNMEIVLPLGSLQIFPGWNGFKSQKNPDTSCQKYCFHVSLLFNIFLQVAMKFTYFQSPKSWTWVDTSSWPNHLSHISSIGNRK